MDPITLTLVSAFAAGAVKGVGALGERAVATAADALKKVLIEGYGKATELVAAVTSLEAKPESEGRRATVAEELKSAGALDDERLIEAAESLLKVVEKHQPAIGIDWQDVKAAQVTIGKIRARAGAIGFRAARVEITGELRIGDIDVGGPAGN